ncbi:WYL domain-containing protein [Lactococcus cremoris]|uniref:helix-turn-helix transcriptional regulator n=1 Tax=Lactococcus TaxID=1357 RepID=UPI00038AF2B9|nr:MULTISPECIES: WYL domain-containing protein [Lactococcus]EQC56353.1 hypothetical protein LLT5_02695 [Lactococcus cremoris subsp. cremoris TIFN5]EQC83964.1 hypothetical protein LLT1_02540 [Lactococcus cremoris subsp. cremoris TIFN1]AXN66123.1 hypothetical protein L3107_1932 [Lactococcus cremoris]MRL66989.1 WYL domain-containing protein [Lactococcus lactis subsp. lactis]MRM51540.1 WYL domain-containing protein [Lactococcus cremoris]
MDKTDKAFRLLQLNEKLNQGGSLKKDKIKKLFNITDKTFQRDIESLRKYYSEQGDEIRYVAEERCYRLVSKTSRLTKQEVFILSKILIESRALNLYEFNMIMDKLLYQCDINDAQEIKKLIGNQKINYIELKHGKNLIQELWKLSEFVVNQEIISFDYERQDKSRRSHKIKPVGIVFSKFYFYLLGYMIDKKEQYPTIFRVDRIENVQTHHTHFSIPYAERFSESEFYKRIQFMTAGELKRIKFYYTGVLEALLDRLPTAVVEKETPKGYIIRAEGFGNGLEMWLRSQGDLVKRI